MIDSPLINQRSVRMNRALRANQKAAKKAERPKKMFDKSTKIYKVVRLADENLLDCCRDVPNEVVSPEDLPADGETILEKIRAAAVSGFMDGEAVADKIDTVRGAKADQKLVVNAVEDDPAILHDTWLLTHRLPAVLTGIAALSRILDFQDIVVASPLDVKADAPGVTFTQVNADYPLGEAHLLVGRVLGVKLNTVVAPEKRGILVLNIQTVVAVGIAAATGKAPAYRYLTAANLIDGTARVVRAPYGTNVEALLTDAFGGGKKGGPYAGKGAMSAHPVKVGERVRRETNAVLVAKPPSYAMPEGCLGCAKCQDNCPLRLPVAGIMWNKQYGVAIHEGMTKVCLGCGACTYFCEASINTVPFVKPDGKQR